MSNQYNDVLVAAMHQATNSENLNAAKNWTLFERVAAGDAAAREEMIVGNMPLAVARVESFMRLCPEVAHLRDDLTSAAFTGLVKAVNQMARRLRHQRPDEMASDRLHPILDRPGVGRSA